MLHKPSRAILIYLFFALMLSYASANAYLTVRQLLLFSNTGWVARVEGDHLVVARANPKGPASSLKPGDQVVELKGLQAVDLHKATSQFWMVPSGSQYDITVLRDGKLQTLSLQTAPYKIYLIATSLMGSMVVPAVFLITALVIFLFRRNDEQVQLLAVMMATFVFDGPFQLEGVPHLVLWLLLAAGTISTVGMATFLHFFLKFPKPLSIMERFPVLGYLVYAPYLFLMMPFALVSYYFWAFSPERLNTLNETHNILAACYNYTMIGYIATGLLCLVFSYTRSSRIERRKIRVVMSGFLVGAVPFMLWNFSPLILSLNRLSPVLGQWYLCFAFTALLLLPISFSYAIIRHQVIPVSVILRRSMRYLLVARGFILIESVFAFFILNALIGGQRMAFLEKYGAKALLMAEVALAVVLIHCGRLIHRKVRPLIDEHFFRSPYDVKAILSDLGNAFVQEHDKLQQLRLVAIKIQDTLYAETVTGWALDAINGEYTCAFSLSHKAGTTTSSENDVRLTLPAGALTIELMSESKRALSVDFPNPKSWVHSRIKTNEATEARLKEHEALATVGAVLMLPFTMKDRLQYVISLGPRLNDLPYSKQDEQMLSSVVWLTTLALENRELFEREEKNQEQLRQAQKMEAVGRLAGGIAHDFNNLLTVINGNSDLALRKLGDDSPVRRNIDETKKAGERAAELTHQLLAFSRKQVLQPKVLQLNSIVADINKMLKQLIGEDIDVLTVLDGELGKVKADPGQIEQVLMNLVVNARDAMPKGGKLTIETANVELDEEYARSHNSVQAGSYVMLAVSDTGCGMDALTRNQIFEPFYTTKDPGKGTGLGLSTVYGIVKQSGGNIWVYSEPGRGTTFKVYFPRVELQLVQASRSTKPAALPPGSETILLVEDEVLVRSMAREILQMSGYEVLEASHGNEALAITKAFHKPIHLMVTDVVMPHMSGPELAMRLEESSPKLKVLYMSGYTDEAIVHHGILDGGVAFLEKPFTPDAFARKVREVLASV